MALFEEELKDFNNSKKSKKINITTGKMFIILSVILIALALFIVGLIMYIKSNTVSIYFNGEKAKNDIQKTIIINSDETIDVNIKDLANLIGYTIRSGEYPIGEDPNKGYISYDSIVVEYEENSNIIKQYYTDDNSDNNCFNIELNGKITNVSGDIIMNSKDAEKILSIQISYDIQKKRVNIYTLDYLYQGYQNNFISAGFIEITSETTKNKMAVLDDMIIIQDSKGKFGVVNLSETNYIVEPKYSKITYLREQSEFLLESSNKKGIVSADKKVKLNIEYDDIQLISIKNEYYYIIKINSLYGLCDLNGNIVVYPEYTQIGLKSEQEFQYNDVESKYIVGGVYIPLKNGNVYYLYNIKDKKILDLGNVVTEIGCKSTEVRRNSAVQIPDYGLTILKNNTKYALLNQSGELIINYLFDSVYFTRTSGVNKYYAIYNGNEVDLEELFAKGGIEKIEND